MTSTTTKTTTTPPPEPEIVHRAAWKAGVMGAMEVLWTVLSIRLVLLVAIAGGIFLTWLALQQPDPYRLGALAIYCATAIVPSVWMAARK